MSAHLDRSGSRSVKARAMLGITNRSGNSHARTVGVNIRLKSFIYAEYKSGLSFAEAEVETDVDKTFKFPTVTNTVVG